MDRLINAILQAVARGPPRADARAGGPEQGVRDHPGQSQASDRRDADARWNCRRCCPSLQSDRLALEQIFSNLVDNALKYLQPGRPGRLKIAGGQHARRCRGDQGQRQWPRHRRTGPGTGVRTVPPRRPRRTSRAKASGWPMCALWYDRLGGDITHTFAPWRGFGVSCTTAPFPSQSNRAIRHEPEFRWPARIHRDDRGR